MAYTLILRDDSDSVNFMGVAYRLRDGGLDIWTPKKKQVWGGESVYSHGSQLVTSTFENRKVRLWFQITGESRSEITQNVSRIEQILEHARQRSIEETGSRVELEYQWDGASKSTYFEVIDGELRWPKDTMSVKQVHQQDENGRWIITNFYLTLVCAPFAYSISPVSGAATELPLTNGNGTDVTGGLTVWNHNDSGTGHDNWVEIDGTSFDSDFNAKVKLVLKSDSGEAEKTSKIYMGVRQKNLGFVNILEDADVSSTVRDTTIGSALADDGGTITDETTEANDSTADDMTLLPAAPAVDDAYYFGKDVQFDNLSLNVSTAGVGTWTITWEYWNGTSWAALTGVTDNTSGFTVSGSNTISYTLPSAWAKTSINQVSVSAAIADDGGAYTDDTTAANNATSDDMTLLPATPAVDDAYYFGSGSPFDKIDLNISTAGAGTWTIVWEYWDGSAWQSIPNVTDDTNGFTASGTNSISWEAPSDWATTTVNSQGPYYYARARISAYTSITTQPLGQQAWIVPEVAYYIRGRVSAFTSLTTQPLGQQVTVTEKITDNDYSSGGSYTVVSFDYADGEVDIFEWALTASQVESTQGPFRIFGRCSETNHWDQDASYSIVIKYGTDVLFQSEWRKPIDTTTELLDFGTVYLPPWLVGTPTGLSALNIAIRAKRDIAGKTTISFDYLELLPQDGGYRILGYRTTGVAQLEYTVDDGWEESVYHINTSGKKTGLPYGLMPRIELKPGVNQRIYFIQEGTAKNCEITRQLKVQVYVVPTYNVVA